MALNWDKCDIEVQNDGTINCNWLFFDFMQQILNQLDGFYLHERCLLMESIMEDKMRKQSAEEIEKLNI